MDAKLKAKWVKALRSGEYHQGKGQLMNADGEFCCLGVLAKIQGCDVAKIVGRATSTLPAGFNAGIRPTDRDELAAKNDGLNQRRHDFKEIADYIEKNL